MRPGAGPDRGKPGVMGEGMAHEQSGVRNQELVPRLGLGLGLASVRWGRPLRNGAGGYWAVLPGGHRQCFGFGGWLGAVFGGHGVGVLEAYIGGPSVGFGAPNGEVVGEIAAGGYFSRVGRIQ